MVDISRPELQGVQVRQLQASQEPVVNETGFSDFTLNLLKQGNALVDKYQEENKTRLIALGVADAVQDNIREVSTLERKNYEQGREYGFLVHNQAQQRKEFDARLNAMVAARASEHDIYHATKEFLHKQVDLVHAANLDPDLKEKLYESSIKELAVYQQDTASKLQAARVNDFQRSVHTMSASMVDELLKTPRTDEARAAFLAAKLGSIEQAYLATHASEGKTLDDARKYTESVFKGSLKYLMLQIDDSDPNSAAGISQLRDLMTTTQQLGYYDLANQMAADINQMEGNILKANDNALDRESYDLYLGLRTGERPLTYDDVSEYLNGKAATGLYSPEQLQSAYERLTGEITRQNEATLAGEGKLDPLQYNSSLDFTYAGGTEDKWVSAQVQDAADAVFKRNPNATHTDVAIEILARARSSNTIEPALIKRAMASATGELAQWARMTPEQLKAQGGWDAYQNAWGGLVKSYQLAIRENNSQLAEDILDAIDDKHFPNKEVLRGLLANGSPLVNMHQALNDPIGSQRQIELMDKALNNLNADNASLENWLFSGHNGSIFKRMSKESRASELESIRTHLMRHKTALYSGMNSDSGEHLMSVAEKKGLLIPSTYSSIRTNPDFGKALNAGHVRGTDGQTLAKGYFVRSVDAHRAKVAQQWGVDPTNVSVEQQGGMFYFVARDSKGSLVNDTGTFGALGTGYTEQAILKLATDFRQADAKSVQRKQVEVQSYRPKTLDGINRHSQFIPSGKFTARRDATLARGTVTIAGTNRKVAVNIPAAVAEAHGWNKELGLEFTQKLMIHEGWVDTGNYTAKDKNGNSATVVGWGITKQNYPEHYNRMLRAKSTQERMQINAEFFNKYYKDQNFDRVLKSAGIPAPTSAPYPNRYKDAYLLLADSTWHGGGGGGMAVARVLRQPNLQTALAEFRKTSVYKAGKDDSHQRNRSAISAITRYYNSNSLRHGQGVQINGAKVQPSNGKAFVPYRNN